MSIWCWTRRALGTGLAALALLGLTGTPAARAGVPVLVLDGTGYGHGVGLSQWGAEYLARTGRSVEQILGTFYPGVGLGKATGPVRVAVHLPGTSTTTLTFPQGGEVRSALEGEQAPGFPVQVGPGGRVRITSGGSYRVDVLVSGQAGASATPYQQDPCTLGVVCAPTTTVPGTTTTTASPTTTTPPGGETPPPAEPGGPPPPDSAAASSPDPVWAVPVQAGVTTVDDRGRSYRGVIEATGGSALRLVNLLGVEDYLRGMAEVPSAWPAAAIQAQTVAARTYALRAMRSGGELCDDARCQVYVGRTAESAAQDAAVAATARQVLTYDGGFAAAVYSADAGGVSATTLEGFGTPDGVYPYLTTVRYETDNPLPWRLELGLGDVARRLGYPGTVTGVRVGRTGPSGRALDLVVDGSAGAVTVNGLQFARALGLRSTRFTATMGTADGAPPPPPVEEAIQALPEEAAALAQQPASPAASPVASAVLKPGAPGALGPARATTAGTLRDPATIAALVLLLGAAAAHVPLLAGRIRGPRLVGRRRGARPWATWRLPTRRR